MMRVSRALWVICAVSFLLGVQDPANVYGQAEHQGKIVLEVVSQKSLPPVEAGSHRILIEKAKEMRMGSLSSQDGRRVLSIEGREEVILPHNLPALVSHDGGMILQFGDAQDLSHPRVCNIYWLDPEGKELGRLEGYYHADAVVSLSDDGFTAIAGSRMEGPQNRVLSLFNTKGERLWERLLGEGRAVHAEAMVGPQGKRVAVITTNSKKPLKDHSILILDEHGKDVSTVSTLGVIQRMVVVGNGSALFVQAQKHHGLIDLSAGSLTWSNEGNVRLIAPRAAAMSPNADVLFLLLADWQGRPQATYRCRLKAMDALTGQDLGDVVLPQEIPGTHADVFGRITGDRIGILSGTDEISISWTR